MFITEKKLMRMVRSDSIYSDDCLYAYLALMSDNCVYWNTYDECIILSDTWSVCCQNKGDYAIVIYECGNRKVFTKWTDYMIKTI